MIANSLSRISLGESLHPDRCAVSVLPQPAASPFELSRNVCQSPEFSTLFWEHHQTTLFSEIGRRLESEFDQTVVYSTALSGNGNAGAAFCRGAFYGNTSNRLQGVSGHFRRSVKISRGDVSQKLIPFLVVPIIDHFSAVAWHSESLYAG